MTIFDELNKTEEGQDLIRKIVMERFALKNMLGMSKTDLEAVLIVANTITYGSSYYYEDHYRLMFDRIKAGDLSTECADEINSMLRAGRQSVLPENSNS